MNYRILPRATSLQTGIVAQYVNAPKGQPMSPPDDHAIITEFVTKDEKLVTESLKSAQRTRSRGSPPSDRALSSQKTRLRPDLIGI